MQNRVHAFRTATVRLDYETLADIGAVRQSMLFQQQLRDASLALEEGSYKGVYFTIPSIDGRSLSRLVATHDFQRVAAAGIRMHHHALTDARIDCSGDLVGFGAEEGEGIGIPDLTTLRPVPWEPRLAQVFCGFYEERSGRIFEHDVRTNLIRLEARLRAGTSAEMRVGIEPEVTLLKERMRAPTPAADALAFYDLASFAALEPVVLDMFDTTHGLGLEISHVDAEGSGQLEVNQAPQGPVAAADSIILFRQALSFIARRHGLTASFMPKLIRGSSGSGLHHHFSLVRAGSDDSILLGDLAGDCRLSQDGLAIVGGLLHHADALTLVGCPWVNSYKRFWDSGHWAPFVKGYGYNNRTVIVRVPGPGRVEVRHFDSSANPYLTVGGLIVSILHGLNAHLDPGQPNQANELKEPDPCDPRAIPLSLESAIRAFEADGQMNELMRPLLRRAFLGIRRDDLARYLAQISPWELEFYLDRLP